MDITPAIAVVIPCYNVKDSILQVIRQIGDEVRSIYVVDDACPEHSGAYVAEHCADARVKIIYQPANTGVGGATMRGYREALQSGEDIIVKLDGDGQMNPALIPLLITPIAQEKADYTKGNRFFYLESIATMPKIRIIGNACLSFISKISTGYWDMFDPTNGFTAIHRSVLARLPLDKIHKRYFFESDMLFRLNVLRAVVKDVPMDAVYGNEVSGLKISSILLPFIKGHLRNTAKRIFYNYYLRNFSIASLELIFGIILLLFGSIFGILKWQESVIYSTVSSAGTVMLAALPIIIGSQLILAFLGFDINNVPKVTISRIGR